MLCRRCHAENREGRRFCSECGLSLAATCSSCGFQNEGDEKFCGGCGRSLSPIAISAKPQYGSLESYTPKHLVEKILISKAALEGERKQVTVLFADLKGSMELLADRDPEEARKILDPVLERMMEAVHRYEGTVNQVMGDGIMALFGAPLAHEDHAVRACYAALRMQEGVQKYAEEVRRTHGAVVKIRVGLNSGEVVVRAIGSDLHMDYTAVGQTTHLAARVEQLAEPGTTLLTAATLALAEDFVQMKSLGPMRVKGLSDAVEVYELVGANAARSRFQAHAARGLTKFVGRANEIAQLAEALDLARRGRGQVVGAVGEPGVGKSRLLWEFAHSHRTDGSLVLEAASVSYGKAITYLPVSELLRGYFQIEPRDDTRKIREKVTDKLLSLDRALEAALPALLALLDVSVDDESWTGLAPPQRRQRTLDAVKGLMLRESHGQPLVVIFEDLHWIDGETQAVLDGLVESLPTARLLLLVNYRPEYRHGWGSKTYYRQVQLDALPAASTEELLEALLGNDRSLVPLKRLLTERTDGNPFFLEESVRALVETMALDGTPGAYRATRALGGLQMPATTQAIVAARVDRLDTEDKRLLQAASVIGKDVSLVLLQAILDRPESELRQSLARLQAAEFLYETRLFPEVEYTFKHALTHEVTYGGLLRERRRELHTRIVHAIEVLHRGRLGEQIERLAHHALHGELWEAAIEYARQAGVRALGRSAHREASTAYEQALRALEHLPETRENTEQAIDLRFALRTALLPLGDFGQISRVLQIAERSASALGDYHRQARASLYIGVSHYARAEHEAALHSLQAAHALGEALGDVGLQAVTDNYVGFVQCARSDFVQGAEFLRRAKDVLTGDLVSQRFGQVMLPSILARAWLAWCLSEIGEFETALEIGEEGLRLAQSAGQPSDVLIAAWGAGAAYARRGRPERAIPLLERSLDVCRRVGLPMYLHYIGAALGPAYALSGHVPHAIAILEDTVAHDRRMGVMPNHALTLASLGDVYVMIGRLDDAAAQAEQALAITRGGKEPGHEAYALRLLGEIVRHQPAPNIETAGRHYHDALALATARGMRPLVADCHLGLGKLYCRAGKREQAQQHLATATMMYREMDMPFWLEQGERELRELS
jgi:class 3 adenylate cyclase/tetratricopeptide (TPR) repeat protein